MQKILAQNFSFAGFEVETAGNGKEGIPKAGIFKPNFILLDIIMPEMDGITALKRFKELPALKEIPIAMLTVLSETVPESMHPEADLEKNVVAYFRKDTEKISDIVNKVRKYLLDNPKQQIT